MAREKTTSAVGLDIGNYSMKCVELSRSDGGIRLDRVSIFPIDRGSASNLSRALKIILDPFLAQNKRIRVSVSGGSSLIIRRVTLPAMTLAELKGAIRFEAESHIPFPIDDCQIDYQILNHSEDRKQMNILLVAAKKDFIKERIKGLAQQVRHCVDDNPTGEHDTEGNDEGPTAAELRDAVRDPFAQRELAREFLIEIR